MLDITHVIMYNKREHEIVFEPHTQRHGYEYIRQNADQILSAFDYAEAAVDVIFSIESALNNYQDVEYSSCRVVVDQAEKQVWGIHQNDSAEYLGVFGEKITVVKALQWLYYCQSV